MKGNKGKIITFASTKGGIGKTIAVLNFAATYGKLGYKVLIIDLDVYSGAIATSINSENEKSIYNVIDDLSNNRFEEIAPYTYKYNELIDIISSPRDPRLANKIDSKFIPMIFDNVKYKYDIILIDTSHLLDEINIITIDHSDLVFYMFSNDIFDLKNTRSFFSIVKDVGMDHVYAVLNASIGRSFFSDFAIRNIIKRDIDYVLSPNLYVGSIDKYLLEGELLLLNRKLKSKKAYKELAIIATSLLEKIGDK